MKGRITKEYNNIQSACKHCAGEVVEITYTKIKYGSPHNTSIQTYLCNKNCGYEPCICCGGKNKEFIFLEEPKK